MLPTSQTSPVPSHRCLIPINIETLAGSSFELLVSPYEQIQYIKRKIERREGIPVSHQHLVWKSNELEDESCLHDYKIEAGTTIKLVLAMRGGPVNTKRVPIEDSFIRDVSEYIESNRDDCPINSDLLPSSNKNVTFLVLRDGDQFNFFQVIDRGDGTLSPLSGSVSNASMYSTHETIAIESERENDEKRLDDDRKTKQKMELIRSKLKTHARKDILPLRPPSATKQSKTELIHHHRRNIFVDSTSHLSTKDINSHATTSSSEPQQQQHRFAPYKFSSTNLFNTYNILAAAAIERSEYLHEEDSEDEEDSHDEDDDQQAQIEQQPMLSTPPPPPPPSLIPVNSKKQQLLTTRSFSPSVFYQKSHHQYEQEPLKKSLYHSHHQDRTTKNLLGQHDSSSTLDTYAQSSMNTILTSSYPSVTLGPVSQETAITTTTSTTSGNDTSTGAVLVDYIPRMSPTLHKQQVPIVSTTSRILSATMNKRSNIVEELPITTNIDCTLDNHNEKITSNGELIYQRSHASPMLELIDDGIISPTNGLISAASIHDDKTETYRKQTADIQSRNDTSLSKPMWTDDDDQLLIGDEFTGGERASTSQSMLSQHRNSSTSTTMVTPIPTFPSVMKKSTLPSTKQQFYHHHKPLNNDQPQSKVSPRTLIPFSLSKYRRIPANVYSTASTSSLSSSQQQTYTNSSNNSSNDLINNGNGNMSNSTESFNERLILNKRIEMFKTPGKQLSSQSTAPSPTSSSTTMFSPVPSQSKRHFQQQDTKSVGTTTTSVPPSSSSLIPLDNTKVTIETIGPKTVTALLRQNATIEPVDTSRGVGKHLVSLLTTASKETTSIKPNYKQSSRDVVIEERYKLDSKLNSPWSNTTSNTNISTVSSSLQSNAAAIYNANKLPSVIVNRKSTSKCFLCKKKTGLATTYQCRCGSSFCSEHRYPEAHACAFDYKAEGKRLIERNNPLVTAPKLPKI
ncbi:unnamed protein product [Adineta steineri]|uniref:AN1-type zinc finger protein 4 n=1 Tax=Adineta steineri TaxID=433720 RepID=A0A818XW57_9BILA|nr:unnamed protein product [Adineta steineri]